MLYSFAEFQIQGYVGRRTEPGGGKVLKVSIAATDRWKDKDSGELHERPAWNAVIHLVSYRRRYDRAYRLHGLRQKPLSHLAQASPRADARKIMPLRDIHNSHPGLETFRHDPGLYRLRPALIPPRLTNHPDTTNEPVAIIAPLPKTTKRLSATQPAANP